METKTHLQFMLQISKDKLCRERDPCSKGQLFNVQHTADVHVCEIITNQNEEGLILKVKSSQMEKKIFIAPQS